MASYYEPFPDQWIRLMSIYPANYHQDVTVSITAVPLLEDSPPAYEALSYVWGTEDDLVLMTVESSTGPASQLSVTQNLLVAVKHLRLVGKPRTMWIDALCINQSDEDEKGPQVARMGIVYRLAARVVVWLGPEENDSDRAMTLIADLSDASKAPGAVEQLKSSTDPPFPPVFRLILRPWFDRLWIRQEIRLGNSQSMVLIGTQTLLWSQFCAGLKRLWLVMWQETSKHTELILRLGSLEGLLFAPPFLDFSNLRQHCGRTLCRDPRDRIYAVLSLLHGADRLEIRPDYTRSVKQVYLDVLRQHVRQSRDVGFLASCEWPKEPSLPS
ncbi:heterokaryon incompatibility protein-domain-containing protein [Apiospora arundinis]|uniref:Heterokaryon incompatibility protein-domain-containing protein n=1 Tax=Apiospora arundinis TaxID=335852 RepID=A0ABR2HT91_9PEZI